MRAIDTNLLVRLIARDDPDQVAKAEAFVERGVWVPHLALAEAIRVLDAVYGLDSMHIATAVEMLLNHKNVTIQDSEVASSALDLFRKNPTLGYSDCLSWETARKAALLPLGTFHRGPGK